MDNENEYTIEKLVETFLKHHEKFTEDQKELDRKILSYELEFQEWMKEPFSFALALHVICKEIEEIKKKNNMIDREWISIKDRLPLENLWIIGGNSKRIEFGIWMGEKKGFQIPQCNYMNLTISHWMPLPEPPKE